MNYLEYELLVRDLLHKQLEERFHNNISVIHQGKLVSASGNAYTVDLYYEFYVGGSKYVTVIECKNWQRPVKREQVSSFYSVIQDLGVHKGIIVTPIGFQEGALKLALDKGIALYKITWQGEMENLSHYDGNFRPYLEELLTISENTASKFDNGFGIAVEKNDVFEYIMKKYGHDISGAFKNGKTVKTNGDKYLPEFSLDWSNDYVLSETAGLNIVLANEGLIRLICHMQRMDHFPDYNS